MTWREMKRHSGYQYHTAHERILKMLLKKRVDTMAYKAFYAMKSFSRTFLYELYKTNDHRTGKGQLSFQSQRKAMPKNVQTTAQVHSSHKLAK